MLATVYVDAFNLYYGCLKSTPYRWLDLAKLCQLLLPKDTIQAIKYFTALVSARPHDPQQPVHEYLLDFAFPVCCEMDDLARSSDSPRLKSWEPRTKYVLQQNLLKAVNRDPSPLSHRSRLFEAAVSAHLRVYDQAGFFELSRGEQLAIGYTIGWDRLKRTLPGIVKQLR
jgi:hypothetical protein